MSISNISLNSKHYLHLTFKQHAVIPAKLLLLCLSADEFNVEYISNILSIYSVVTVQSTTSTAYSCVCTQDCKVNE